MQDDQTAPPPSQCSRLSEVARSTVGVCLGIGSVAFLSDISHVPFLTSFGPTCIMAFSLPDSPMSQPRSIIGGHLIAATVGLVCLQIFGVVWWCLALGTAAALVLMYLTNTFHPPAGSSALFVIVNQQGWGFLLAPLLLGSLVIVVVALIFNNLRRDRRYPTFWL